MLYSFCYLSTGVTWEMGEAQLLTYFVSGISSIYRKTKGIPAVSRHPLAVLCLGNTLIRPVFQEAAFIAISK